MFLFASSLSSAASSEELFLLSARDALLKIYLFFFSFFYLPHLPFPSYSFLSQNIKHPSFFLSFYFRHSLLVVISFFLFLGPLFATFNFQTDFSFPLFLSIVILSLFLSFPSSLFLHLHQMPFVIDSFFLSFFISFFSIIFFSPSSRNAFSYRFFLFFPLFVCLFVSFFLSFFSFISFSPPSPNAFCY
ncbi:unnamed protein product [Acanthosepion pharaonis]|uniref:Uncharacterized protein n=1 Tax=Acanthosepion pharaonis TaxID=158019 RepID=A0A812DR82_ACAPH|nr:unnamed protein product [Sepia pharaonis]